MLSLKKLLSPLQNIHFQSLAGNGVMAIFGMLTIALLYRALSVKDIGIYVFFMSLLGLVDTLRTGFLTIAFVKFYSGTTGKIAREIAGSAWCLSLIITLFLIILNLIFYLLPSFNDNEGVVLFFQYFSLITFATLPSFMATLVVQGDKRFDRLLWIKLINQSLFTGTIAITAYLGNVTLVFIIYTYIITNLVAGLTAVFLGWTMIGAIQDATKERIMEIFHFGKYSVGTSLSTSLFKVTDIMFINFFLGPAALAVYNLGGRLMQLIEIPLISFVASGMPSLSAYYNNNQKEEMIYVMKKMIGMITFFIFIIAVLSIIFAEPLIGLMGGAKYMTTEAPNLFRMFMCIAILVPADRFFALTLDVIHMPKINFIKILIMLAANILADFIGLYFYKSVYVIAFVNVIPVILAIVISFPYLNRYSRFNFWDIYVIGFKETVLFVKQVFRTVFVGSK